MSSNLYASVAELKDRLGITDSSRDFALDRVLEGASRWIDRSLGRRFYAATETRYYTLCLPDGYWGELYVDDVLSVSELICDENGDGVFDRTWTAGTDFHLSPRNAPLDGQPYTHITREGVTGRFSFPTYPDAIKVTGSFGYCTLATCPAGIRELTLMVAELNARPLLDTSIPGVSTYRLGVELTVTMDTKNLPPMVGQIMDEFRRKAYVF